MKKIKILNLYAGIGGNRKLWNGDIEVTAIENDPKIAAVYQTEFPNDKVIIADAHEYLLKHYKEFDFIWSSPPCPSHSDIRRCGVHKGQYEALYPDMSLYQEIILLKHFAPTECKWVVENVKPYYDPLIEPNKIIHRHCFWTNFVLSDVKITDDRKHTEIVGSKEVYGFDISNTNIKEKRKVLRNMVDPNLGLHIFTLAFKEKQSKLEGFE